MRRRVAAAGLLAFALAGSAGAAGKPLVWDEVFSLKGAPRGVHFKASYLDGQARSHALEVWRDGDAHVRRRTDGRLDLFADKQPGGELAFRIVDLEKKRVVEVNRTNLHRIGVFASFPALAGVPVRPPGASTLVAGSRPRAKTPAGGCRWLRLESPGARAREICWSDRFKVPLLVQEQAPAGGFTTVFQVDALEPRVPTADVFRVSTVGLTVVHADQDIDPSGD